MTETYHAMQVTQSGLLELVTGPMPKPGPGKVLIAVSTAERN